MRFESVSRTDVGLKRKINEDSVLEAPDRGLWAVADGMGGHEAGEVASAMVVAALRDLSPDMSIDSTIDKIRSAVADTNSELINLAVARSSEKSIGTTIVGLSISANEFRCFWAGDSRAYLLRDGEMLRLSRDHSLVQSLVDAGMLSPQEAENHPNSNVVTRAVGVSGHVELDVVGGEARSGDQFLLASDGLTRVVDDDELAMQLARNPPDRAADALIDLVLRRGAPDNVSLVIVKID